MSLQDLNPGDIPDCLSLKQYLTNILLPAFQPSNAGRSRVTQISRARQWPKYAELQREPGTRRLREVLRVDPWQFALLTEDCELQSLFMYGNILTPPKTSINLLRAPTSSRIRLTKKNKHVAYACQAKTLSFMKTRILSTSPTSTMKMIIQPLCKTMF